MQLSMRLRMNASLVTPGNRLADVGTDHGYIPIALVEEGVIPSALAMDVNEGPLMRAEEHIRLSGLASYIETRLSDGLEKLGCGEADSVLVAGMGGPLMIRILSEGKRQLAGVRELIVQPQSEIGLVRHFLEESGWNIDAEDMVREDGKYYTAIHAVPVDMAWGQEVFYRYGKTLLENHHPVLGRYLKDRERICGQILENLDKNGRNTEIISARIREMKQELDIVREGLAYYETVK